MSRSSSASVPPSDPMSVAGVRILYLSFDQKVELRDALSKYFTKLPKGTTLSSPDGRTYKSFLPFLMATLRFRGYKPISEGFKESSWIGNGDAIHIIYYRDGGLIFDLSDPDWDDGALTWLYNELVQKPEDVAEEKRRQSNHLRQMTKETNRLKKMNEQMAADVKRKYDAMDSGDIEHQLEDVRRKRAALEASEIVQNVESDLEDEYGDW